MTHPYFGRITPIQREMLALAAYRLDRVSRSRGARRLKGEAALEQMLEAVRRLQISFPEVSADLSAALDLARWHRELVARREPSYVEPLHTWRLVRRHVEASITDPEYRSLTSKLAGFARDRARDNARSRRGADSNDLQLAKHPLFESVAAAPLDDGPRLALAEALRADGHRARGELIAGQCRLARLLGEQPLPAGFLRSPSLRSLAGEGEAEARELSERVDELLYEHPKWTPALEEGGEVTFWRGFIGSVTLRDVSHWTPWRFEALLAQTPLVSQVNLVFPDSTHADLEFQREVLEVVVRRLGACLETLTVEGGDPHVLASALAKAPLPYLQQLNPRQLNLTREGQGQR